MIANIFLFVLMYVAFDHAEAEDPIITEVKEVEETSFVITLRGGVGNEGESIVGIGDILCHNFHEDVACPSNTNITQVFYDSDGSVDVKLDNLESGKAHEVQFQNIQLTSEHGIWTENATVRQCTGTILADKIGFRNTFSHCCLSEFI